MNHHLKLAYDTGVTRALEEAGVTKEANLFYKAKDFISPKLRSLLESRPVSAITGRRVKGLTGEALEREQAVVDAARAYGLLGTGAGAGLGYWAYTGNRPNTRAAGVYEALFD